MLPHTISIAFLTMNTYPFLLGMGIIICLGITFLSHRLAYTSPTGGIIDVCLAGLASGLILGRAGHILIHWTYFSEHTSEIIQINAGGLNWHSALIGGMIGMLGMRRLAYQQVDSHIILESWAWAIPIIGFMGWWACSTFFCGYGAEVGNLTDYPSSLVWEAPAIDGMIAPRFATHPLAMLWAVILWGIIAICVWRGWLKGQRFGVSLILWSAGMVLIGFLRGDAVPTVYNLRIDQWLDALMLVLGMAYIFWHKKPLSTQSAL